MINSHFLTGRAELSSCGLNPEVSKLKLIHLGGGFIAAPRGLFEMGLFAVGTGLSTYGFICSIPEFFSRSWFSAPRISHPFTFETNACLFSWRSFNYILKISLLYSFLFLIFLFFDNFFLLFFSRFSLWFFLAERTCGIPAGSCSNSLKPHQNLACALRRNPAN